MKCATPKLSESVNISDTGQRLDLSLILEEFYTTKLTNIVFTVYPNPLIDLSGMVTTVSAGDPLVIKVQMLYCEFLYPLLEHKTV